MKMKARTILEIRNLLQDKAKSSEEEYANESNRLKKKYNTDWITDHCEDEELYKLNKLKSEKDKWKKVFDEFENNEF